MGDSTIIAAIITAIAFIIAALITVGTIKFDTVDEAADHRPSDVFIYDEPPPTPDVYVYEEPLPTQYTYTNRNNP